VQPDAKNSRPSIQTPVRTGVYGVMILRSGTIHRPLLRTPTSAGVKLLHEFCVMPQLVNLQFEPLGGEKISARWVSRTITGNFNSNPRLGRSETAENLTPISQAPSTFNSNPDLGRSETFTLQLQRVRISVPSNQTSAKTGVQYVLPTSTLSHRLFTADPCYYGSETSNRLNSPIDDVTPSMQTP
jgi:hypothetical protein